MYSVLRGLWGWDAAVCFREVRTPLHHVPIHKLERWQLSEAANVPTVTFAISQPVTTARTEQLDRFPCLLGEEQRRRRKPLWKTISRGRAIRLLNGTTRRTRERRAQDTEEPVETNKRAVSVIALGIPGNSRTENEFVWTCYRSPFSRAINQSRF